MHLVLSNEAQQVLQEFFGWALWLASEGSPVFGDAITLPAGVYTVTIDGGGGVGELAVEQPSDPFPRWKPGEGWAKRWPPEGVI
jgi:hypothetical protein